MKKKHIWLMVACIAILYILFYIDASHRVFTSSGIIGSQMLTANINVYYLDNLSDKIEVAQETVKCVPNEVLTVWRSWNSIGETNITTIDVSPIRKRNNSLPFRFLERRSSKGRAFIVTIYAAQAMTKSKNYDQIVLSLEKTISEYLCIAQHANEEEIYYFVELVE